VVSLAASMLLNPKGSDPIAALHSGGLLAGLAALQVIGVVGVALSPTLWLALVALWLKGAAAVVAAPVLATWLNQNVDSGVRATVLSLDGQANAVGQVLGGPPLGLLAGRTSVRLALVVSAGLLAPTIAVFAAIKNRDRLNTPPSVAMVRGKTVSVERPTE
jgi:MFS family permease